LTPAFKPVVDRRGLYAPNLVAGGKGMKAAPALRIVAAAG
jgi:hypothetical protein